MTKKSLIQFKILRGTDADIILAKELLDRIAHKYSMADTFVTSRAEGTMLNYSEKIGNGFALGARSNDSMIIVDINPGRDPGSQYSEFLSDISRELHLRFGTACVESGESDWIPVTNMALTREHAERMKAFLQQHVGKDVIVKIAP